MNLYGGPIEEYFNENEHVKGNGKASSEMHPTAASKCAMRKQDRENALPYEQIMELRSRYDLSYMTCEEQESLLDELCRMGALTKEDCASYMPSDGNISEALTQQFNADIKLLYKMSIAGRYSNSHMEHIKSQQKILDLLEQLMAD